MKKKKKDDNDNRVFIILIGIILICSLLWGSGYVTGKGEEKQSYLSYGDNESFIFRNVQPCDIAPKDNMCWINKTEYKEYSGAKVSEGINNISLVVCRGD